MRYSAALTTAVDDVARQHLLRRDGQEDVCFGLWYPSQGERRFTALVEELILPMTGDRVVHGNAAFTPAYVQRAIGIALEKEAGLVFLHSHLGPGWQGMSEDDIVAEQGLAPTAQGATHLPLVGMTLGTDGAWSARLWERTGRRAYARRWCESLRVAGERLSVTYNDRLLPPPIFGTQLTRTISAWGGKKQQEISRLKVGVVGAGSVGSVVAEALARTGISTVVLFDFESVEQINLDRLLHATQRDVGRAKVDVLAGALRRSATASPFTVLPLEHSIVEEAGFRAALDCDLLFCCVDRPWPRSILNFVAYAHLIPVVDGGVAINARVERGLRHGEIRAHVAAPTRRCLECLGQYKSELVSVERDGFLDDPSYIQGFPVGHELRRRENVFAFSTMAAAMEMLQALSMVVAPSGMSNPGAQLYHFVTGTLEAEEEWTCRETCIFPGLVAKGDRAGLSFTGKHPRAEAERAARRTLGSRLRRVGRWLKLWA
jgi:molybdopterin-synthase adenylyltransferase